MMSVPADSLAPVPCLTEHPYAKLVDRDRLLARLVASQRLATTSDRGAAPSSPPREDARGQVGQPEGGVANDAFMKPEAGIMRNTAEASFGATTDVQHPGRPAEPATRGPVSR